jgi:hypothetical protein
MEIEALPPPKQIFFTVQFTAWFGPYSDLEEYTTGDGLRNLTMLVCK